jgi:hypothetical protein
VKIFVVKNFAFLLFCLVSYGLFAQSKISDLNLDRSCAICLKIKMGKQIYNRNGLAKIEISLINKSKNIIYFYYPLDQGESASISFWLKDVNTGKNALNEFIADAMPPPPVSRKEFFKLNPGDARSVMMSFNLSQVLLKKGATYDLVAEYHSPISKRQSFGLPIWSRENGVISSNHFQLKIEN